MNEDFVIVKKRLSYSLKVGVNVNLNGIFRGLKKR